jgi:transcriptional regulator GlxA family with amidase domain
MSQEHFGFLLFDGFSNLVLANAVEPLRAANQLSGQELFERSLLTVSGAPAVSSSRIAIPPDRRLADAGPLDLLFVVAGYDFRARATEDALAAVRLASARSRAVAGLDTGSWLLGAAGVIDGQRATIHWQELDAFAEAFPAVEVISDRYVIDGRTITSGGATAVLDLMLRLIRERRGDALTFDVMNLFIYDVERAYELPYRGARSRRIVELSPKLISAITLMRRTIEVPLSIPEIALRVASSRRSLERAFQREFEMPPSRYYHLLRLQTARRFAEETRLGVAEIAVRTGFSSAATLSRAFSAHFNTTIRAIRKARRSWRRTGPLPTPSGASAVSAAPSSRSRAWRIGK